MVINKTYFMSLILFAIMGNSLVSCGEEVCFQKEPYALEIGSDSTFSFYIYNRWDDEVTVTKYAGKVSINERGYFLDSQRRIGNLNFNEEIIPEGFFDFQFNVIKGLFGNVKIRLITENEVLKSCDCDNLIFDKAKGNPTVKYIF